jgi:hypothetical protein
MERAPETLHNGENWNSPMGEIMRCFAGFITLAWFASFICYAQSRGHSEADLPNIVLNSATVADYGEFNARVKSLERATCNDPSRSFEKPMVVKDFVGAKVRTIRVIHYLRQREPPKPDEIRQLVRKVWDGSFQSADCGILWSEGGAWSIEFALKFQDGKQGLLITDGVHVALRDHEGKNWFFRLLPAGQ